MVNIAILLACHNRRNLTIKCIEQLFVIDNCVDVFCVDDNSNDGTADAVAAQFPQTHLIHGDGNLFWCRGMRKAWLEAAKYKEYDYYFWLNDDLELYNDCFDEMLECSRLMDDRAIIGGLVQESTTKKAIYGGFDKQQKIIEANGELNEIERLNGNFVLVPKYVYDRIGVFDPVYHHDLGDVAYGYEVHKFGLHVCTSRKYIGCTDAALKSKNMRIRMHGVSIVKRFQKLYSPLGSNPNITFYFMNKYRGAMSAIAFYLYVHIINCLPDFIWDKISK